MGKSQRGQRCAKHGVPKTVNHEARWMCVYCRAAMNSTFLRQRAKDPAEPLRKALQQGSLTHPTHPFSCMCGCRPENLDRSR